MSHFGRSGPPDIKDTFSLLVLNITFRTSADDLYPLFIKYGKVVDIFIPRDRRTGDSRGFAFVRYKYADEASKAVERLDGRNVDGRNIMVQFAKYGPNAERIHKGRVIEDFSRTRDRSPSRSPRPRYRDEYRGRNYRSSRSPRRRYERDRYDQDMDYHDQSRSCSQSLEYHGRRREKCIDYKNRSRSWSHSLSPEYRRHVRDRHDDYNDRSRSHSLSYRSGSPAHHSITPERSMSPRRTATRTQKYRSPPPFLDRHRRLRNPSLRSVE